MGEGTLSALLSLSGGAAVSNLPRRLWSRFDLPVASCAWFSALATLALGLLIGVHEYIGFAKALGDAAASQVLELSERLNTGQAAGVNPGLPMLATVLGPFGFLLTPWGFLAAYLVTSGVVRALAAAVSEPRGDLLLTLLDSSYQEHRRRSASEQAIAERLAREGPEVPDLVERGKDAGYPDAEWVITSSRIKPGWEKGVFVVTPERWFRIVEVVDHSRLGGLRRLYVLEGVGQAEVIRRSVLYDHPELSPFHDRRADLARSAAELFHD